MLIGGLVGLTGMGGGSLPVYPLTVAKIVGTDIFHAAALLWVAGFGHLVAGSVDLHAMAWLLLGSIPGVLLTSQLTLQLPGQALRLGLAATPTGSCSRASSAAGSRWWYGECASCVVGSANAGSRRTSRSLNEARSKLAAL